MRRSTRWTAQRTWRQSFAAVACSTLLLATSSPALASGDGLKGPAPAIVPHCLAYHEGCRPGVWLSLAEGKRLLKVDNRRIELQIKVDWLERLDKARGRQVVELEQIVDGQRAAVVEAAERARQQRERADRLEGRFPNALASPYMWAAIGLVAGGLLGGYVASR